MLEKIGRFAARRGWLIVIVAIAAAAGAGSYGGNVQELLTSGGFEDANSESAKAAEILETEFNAGDPNLIVLASTGVGGGAPLPFGAPGAVDDPAAAAAGTDLIARLAAEPGVEQVAGYWSLGSPPPLRSEDGTKALILGRIAGNEDEVGEVANQLKEKYQGQVGPLEISLGGQALVFTELGETAERDLVRAETIAIPITLILLLVVFRSAVSGFLPLVVGGLAIVSTLGVLKVMTQFMDVSVFAMNITTSLGLGLGIDYSLFMVSRFREELAAGHSKADAVWRTATTAGRTVTISGITVAVSLAALLVFPLAFLRSFAVAGIAVVLIAAAVAVVVLPAIFALLGHRVNSLRIGRRRSERSGEDGFWHRTALLVMRRPLPIALGVTAILLVLGSPFLGVKFGLPDDRTLPPDSEVRAVQTAIRTEFASNEAGSLSVVIPDAAAVDEAALSAYATDLSNVTGVARVDALTGSFIGGLQVAPPTPISQRFAGDNAAWLSVVPSIEPNSPEGETMAKAVRALPSPAPVLVSGGAAGLVDSKASVAASLPLAGAIVAGVTFVLLFLSFGSLLVPAKAVVLNLLSLTATFGAMVWVFQEGHLSGLLNFTATGTLDTTNPILMFCIAFGLSMDYEVFLLSRIKEEYDRTGDTISSVAIGLEKTGAIVTQAAALLAIVLVAFATSGITLIKMVGLGLALAVVMDATLVRATLVPAFMRLAGRANWWAPAPLRRFQRRFGISEASEPVEVPV